MPEDIALDSASTSYSLVIFTLEVGGAELGPWLCMLSREALKARSDDAMTGIALSSSLSLEALQTASKKMAAL